MKISLRSRIFISCAILIALFGYILGWSNLLEIRNIEVSGIKGAHTLTEKLVIKKSGIKRGDKLARVNSGTVSRALQQLPEIEKVSINRKPLHSVEIAITLRKIDLAIGLPSGRFLLGDASGITFEEVAQAPRGVPVLTGDRRFLADAMSIYASLPHKLQKQVGVIDLPSRASISLQLRGGLTIFWGGTDDPEAKLSVLAALLAAPENKRARFIDIATPLSPTVR